ncbi:MAG: hypothetical protein CMC99_06240 [Flavobacteriales bacterium]|nr:hypothetical protein [Flavobacteriales bacterium]
MSPTSYQLLHPAMWVPLLLGASHDLANSGGQMYTRFWLTQTSRRAFASENVPLKPQSTDGA